MVRLRPQRVSPDEMARKGTSAVGSKRMAEASRQGTIQLCIAYIGPWVLESFNVYLFGMMGIRTSYAIGYSQELSLVVAAVYCRLRWGYPWHVKDDNHVSSCPPPWQPAHSSPSSRSPHSCLTHRLQDHNQDFSLFRCYGDHLRDWPEKRNLTVTTNHRHSSCIDKCDYTFDT